MSYTRTVSEFSSVRKVRYGDNNKNDDKTLGSQRPITTPLRCDEAISPHQAYFGKDSNGNQIYVVEFNIGQFHFNELKIRTEGTK